jgi:hypothetical protein
MNLYEYCIHGTASIPKWTFRDYRLDDQHAIEYGIQLVRQFVGVPWFLSMTIYSETEQKVIKVLSLFQPPPVIQRDL